MSTKSQAQEVSCTASHLCGVRVLSSGGRNAHHVRLRIPLLSQCHRIDRNSRDAEGRAGIEWMLTRGNQMQCAYASNGNEASTVHIALAPWKKRAKLIGYDSSLVGYAASWFNIFKQ